MYKDRDDAGMQLAERLRSLQLHKPIVLALPRGGVPIGYTIAEALHAPLDVVLVRKIGAPFQKELAIGAVTDGDPPYVFIDRQMIAMMGVSESYIEEETRRQIAEIERRRSRYGVLTPPPSLEGCTAVVVDDGIATGATVRVALQSLRQRKPAAIVLAVPVAAADSLADLQTQVDRVVCLSTPDYFPGVGAFYRDFTQVDDTVVIDLLQRARKSLNSHTV
ncbi:MAG TPA: phosphoribosyltransferase [Spongiibacteraceae bacterium]|nr:phosphoribosyltransferase [Spongiibacteraceae bacterium]